MVDCLSRRKFLELTVVGLIPLGIGHFTPGAFAETRVLKVFKSPSCGCCGAWVDHMRSAGFRVEATDVTDLSPIKNKLGVFPELWACHSAVIDGYVIEGHVPAREVIRLLRDRPKAIGLAVPGMPIGSPGMEQGSRRDPFQVILFSSTRRSVFATYPQQILKSVTNSPTNQQPHPASAA
jgi:hypothetical protein